MLRKIFKTGHSTAVTLSKALLKDAGLKLGDEVRIDVDQSKEIIIIQHAKKEHQLQLNLKLRPKL